MNLIIGPFIQMLMAAIDLYIWAIVLGSLLNWITVFRVFNIKSPLFYRISDLLDRIAQPALRKIRMIVPELGGVDISPVVLILILYFLENVLARLLIYFG
jgi:YggT family protein